MKKDLFFILFLLCLVFVSAMNNEMTFDLTNINSDVSFMLNTNNESDLDITSISSSLTYLSNLNIVNDFEVKGENIFINFNPEKDLDKMIINEEGIMVLESINSFIVEFKQPSILEKKKELEEEILILEKSRDSDYDNGKLLSVSSMGSSIGLKQQEVEVLDLVYRDELEEIHEDALKDIFSIIEVKESGVLMNFFASFLTGIGITGFVVSNEDSLPVLEEQYFIAFNGIVLSDVNDDDVNKIDKLESVKQVSPNSKVYMSLYESVPLIQNGIVAGKLDEDGNDCMVSGKKCLTGEGVSIAIIDTGIDYTHPDLGGCFGEGCRVVGGYDFINYDDDPMDDHGHGTHCAGIAAGNGVLNGVAPNATLYAYKVLSSSGSGETSGIIAAIEKTVDPNGDGDYSDKIDVISLSLGGSGDPDDPISTAIDNVVNAGVIAVIAAGNSGPSAGSIGSPGTARNAITVGATYKRDYGETSWDDDAKVNNVTKFSSRGPVVWSGGMINKPDILAPGAIICSAQWEDAWSDSECIDSEHTAISGTSMATPHIAGVAAVLLETKPYLDPFVVKDLLKSTAVDLNYDVNTQGAGLVNLSAALNEDILIYGNINFESMNVDSKSKTLYIRNDGEKDISVSLSDSGSINEDGDSFSGVSFSEESFSVLSGEVKEVLITLDVGSIEKDGFYNGMIEVKVNDNINIKRYSFGIYSNLNLTFEGHYPDYQIVNIDDFSIKRIGQGYEMIGDEYNVLLRSGEYLVYAINDRMDSRNPFLSYETDRYMIGKIITVGFRNDEQLDFSLDDGRLFTFEARDMRGNKFELDDLYKYIVYEKGWKRISSSYSNSDYGDIKIYLSNNPTDKINVTHVVKYYGGADEREI